MHVHLFDLSPIFFINRDKVFSEEAFVKSNYPPDVVVWGWNNARGTAAA